MAVLEASRGDCNLQRVLVRNEIALKNSHLLNFLVHDILDYSMLTKGCLRTSTQKFNIVDAVNDILDLEREQAELKGIQLLCEHQLSIAEQEIFSDKRRLQQVILNLVANALKFTQTGSVKVELQRNEAIGAERVHVRVRDTGCGIAPEI